MEEDFSELHVLIVVRSRPQRQRQRPDPVGCACVSWPRSKKGRFRVLAMLECAGLLVSAVGGGRPRSHGSCDHGCRHGSKNGVRTVVPRPHAEAQLGAINRASRAGERA